MSDNPYHTLTPTQNVSLAELAERVRAAYAAIRAAESNALDLALVAGDALLVVRALGVEMKSWLLENCRSFGLSTAKLYMQLASHRVEIELARQEDPNLSLREARRLITRTRRNQGAETLDAPPANVEVAKQLQNLSDEEWTDALRVALGLERFLKVMPDEWRSTLQRRAGGQFLARVKAEHPNTRMKNLKLTVIDGGTEGTPTTH